MKAVQKIRSLLHQPKPIVSAGDDPFKAPDRTILSVMRELAARRSVYEVSRSPVQSGRKHRTDRLDMRGYFELI